MPQPPSSRGPAAAADTRALCESVSRWRYDDLPPAVIGMLKQFLLDELGVIAGAARAPGIAELNARLARWDAGGSATGLLGKRRYSPPNAAMANGAAGHALDFDDLHDAARVHTNCVVLPTLLAAAEDAGPIGGREFLLAHAIGTELHARLGLACFNSLGKGWHPTMIFGTLAASVGAARLLGLDAAGLQNALGIAYHQAGGSAQSMRDGVLTKRLGAGFAARAAVFGAFLAADGITGTRRTLEGNAGLFALYERGEVDASRLFDDLGSRWHVVDYSLKPYPCCRCNHTVIGIGIDLHREGVRPDAVAAVEIGMGRVNWMTVGEPYEAGRDDVVHAQFNAAYGFARALADGCVDLASYTRPRITDPAIAAFASRVTVVEDPSIEATALEPARVVLRLREGDVIERRRETVKGSPAEPMSEAERLGKFRDCLAFGLGATTGEADRLAEAVHGIEHTTDAAAALVGAFPLPRAP